MTTENQNLYEGMYIISPMLSDEARKKALARIESGITERGGKVLKVHDMERKRLAYPIEKHKEGHYYLLFFEIEPSKINELWREYHLNEDLMRFTTLRAEEVLEKIAFKSLEEVS